MKKFFKGAMLLAPFSLAIALMPSASAVAITLQDKITNAEFDTGGAVGACPATWTCFGSPSPGWQKFQATANEYTAGADGLTGGRITPSGAFFASGPTPSEGSGVLRAVVPSLGLTIGQDYTISFFIGTPLHVPGLLPGACGISNPTCAASKVGFLSLEFYNANTLQQLAAFNLTSLVPDPGQWKEISDTFTYNGALAGVPLLVQLRTEGAGGGGGSGNDKVLNIDFQLTPETGTPEPGSMALFGLGLVGLGAVRRLRKNKA